MLRDMYQLPDVDLAETRVLVCLKRLILVKREKRG